MLIIHKKPDRVMDFAPYINRHSGDETIAYKEVFGSPILLSFYYPDNYDAKKKYPVFVFVHGGGWEGHKIFPEQESWQGDYLGYLARYYADKGFVAVSIDYRLMKDLGQKEGYGLIDIYEDCADAVEFLKENSDKYGIDFSRSVVLGESAGGYLAAALATFTYKYKPAFANAIIVNGITDLYDSNWGKRLPKDTEHPKLKEKSLIERAHFLSPTHQINDSTPPTLLLHGVDDTIVRPRHSQAFHDEMQLNKKDCTLHYIEGTKHAFLLTEYMYEFGFVPSQATLSIEIIDEWLKDKF